MSIFGSILRKIFPSNHPAVTGTTSSSATTAATPGPTGTVAAQAGSPAASSAGASQAAAVQAAPPVDVEAVLSGLAAKNPQPLNWRESIVDLMKLLQLDSSLESRKQLAKELGYTGGTADSATMNNWLHAQVMTRLAQNGGKVPEELKA